MNSSMENKKLFNIVALNLAVIYLTGLCGISLLSAEHRSYFLLLTPLNLLLTTISMLLFHPKRDATFYRLALMIAVAGYFIEVLGVQSGLVFGHYWYGKTLGFSLFGVPPMIGLNWFMLVYCIAASLQKIRDDLLHSLACAGVMTMLDVLIEPVAIRLDFWHWENEIIPLQNFVAWFVIAFLLFLFFRKTYGRFSNPFTRIVLAILFLFFGLLNVILH